MSDSKKMPAGDQPGGEAAQKFAQAAGKQIQSNTESGTFDRVDHVWIYRDHARRGFSFGAVTYEHGGRADREDRATLAQLGGPGVEYRSDRLIDRATIHLTDSQAHRLMDLLWSDGVRPSEYRGGDEVVEAVREQVKHKDEHIEDLRFFAKLNAQPVELCNPTPMTGGSHE